MHNNIPEGPSYPSRGVTDGRYYYIKNLQPEKLYIQKYIMGRPNRNPYWETWLFASDDNKSSESIVKRYMIREEEELDRKSTRLNSSHVAISYAVFCLKKKKRNSSPAGYSNPNGP